MFNNRTKHYVREQGGMYELHKEFVDMFLNDGFNLREINSYSLYLHYGTENGKIGIQIVQKTINEVVVYVGEELPFKRKNEFKIETISQINSSMLFEKVVSHLKLVKYPYKDKVDNDLDSIIEAANGLYYQENFNEALKLYKEAEMLYGETTKITLQKAGCYLKLGLNNEALELITKARRKDTNNSMVYLTLGQYYFNIDNTLQGMVALNRGADLGCETCKTLHSKLSNEMFGDK